MYKRYYDGYRSGSTAYKDRGEIITPRCADDTYPKKDECKIKECEKKECETRDCEIRDCEKKDCEKKSCEIKACEKNDICEEKGLCCTVPDSCPAVCNRFSFPGELDDIILAGILLLLLWDNDSFDPILLVIVGFVLFADVL